MVVTTEKPKKGDTVMDITFQWHEPAEAPPIVPINGTTNFEEVIGDEPVVTEEPVIEEVIEVVKPAPKKRTTKK